MPFLNGRVSYCRFRAQGSAGPKTPEDALTQLYDQRFVEISGVTPPEIETGFTAGGHIYDMQFDYVKNVYGNGLHFAFRFDTNKVPAEVKKAFLAQHESSAQAASETGYISKAEKREAKQMAQDQMDVELASGRFRKSKQVHIYWDMDTQLVYCANSSVTITDEFKKRFREAFGLTLEDLSAGSRGAEIARDILKLPAREWEDLQPQAFSAPPQEENVSLVLPWIAKSLDMKDFLGNTFLMWLIYMCDVADGSFTPPEGASHSGELQITPCQQIVCQCAWDYGGTATVKHNTDSEHIQNPVRSPEIRKALFAGKWPRSCQLMMQCDGPLGDLGVQLAVQGDRWLVTGMALPVPDGTQDASPRENEERRIEEIKCVEKALDSLYATFLAERASSAWGTKRQQMTEWIAKRANF